MDSKQKTEEPRGKCTKHEKVFKMCVQMCCVYSFVEPAIWITC